MRATTGTLSILMGLLWLVSGASLAQEATLYGRVLSGGTGEPLPWATCLSSESGAWSVADEHGRYALVLPRGEATVVFSFSGYRPDTLRVVMSEDRERDIHLAELQLGEVVVLGREVPLHKQTLSGSISLNMERLRALPSFTGQPDVVRALAFLPGVASGKELNSGIFVRGGSSGQNLFLLDGVPLYNTNHFGGFFSTINPDVVKELDFYKGGFPARYGGRLSAVVDMRSRAGNLDSLRGSFNLGLVSSNLLLEGPLGDEGRTSFLLGTRGFYLGLLTFLPARNVKRNGSGRYLTYSFFDINAKVEHASRQGARLYLNAYTGSDFYDTYNSSPSVVRTTDFYQTPQGRGTDWFSYRLHNTTLSAGWEKRVRPKTLLGVRVGFSHYGNLSEEGWSVESSEFYAEESESARGTLRDLSVGATLNQSVGQRHNLRLGIEAKSYWFDPNRFGRRLAFSPLDWEFDTVGGGEYATRAEELAAYWEDEWRVGPGASLNLGVRQALFFTGPASFPSFEPRLSIRKEVGQNGAFKLGATYMRQFLHVLANNEGGLAREIWLPASRYAEPGGALQFSGGWFGLWPRAGLEYGVEGYHKSMRGLVEYADLDPNLNLEEGWERNLATGGTGQAYGLEFFAQRKAGRISGSLSYTLSWAWRTFADLNQGRRFPFSFDRRHDLSLVGFLRLNDDNLLSGQFVLSSGMPVTLPKAYVPGGPLNFEQYLYDGINNMRMPTYHRLDLMYRRRWVNQRGTESHVTINIYNAYARTNASTVYYSNGKATAVGTLTAFPSVSFGTEF